jgi:hypothetical protein
MRRGAKSRKSANRIIFEFTKIKTCHAGACTLASALAECAKRDFLVSQLQQQHAASSYGIHNSKNTTQIHFTEKDQGIWCDVLIPNNFYTLQIFVVPCIVRSTVRRVSCADLGPAAPESYCAARHSRSTASTGTRYQPGP